MPRVQATVTCRSAVPAWIRISPIAALTRAIDPGTLDPANIDRTFRIAALDFDIARAAPHLIDVLAKDAPGARLAGVGSGEARQN